MGIKLSFRKLSIKGQVMLGVMVIPVVSSFLLLAVFYTSIKGFYTEKIQDMQDNNMQTALYSIQDFTKQCAAALDQILGMAVFQDEFEEYSQKNTYEKLKVSRKITSQMLNIKLANKIIDDIYILDFEGNGFSTNSQWNQTLFEENLPEKLDRSQLGKKLVLPPHPAGYGYNHTSQNKPLVISFLIYLNQYTESGTVGLVQIDISYRQLEKIMSGFASGEDEFLFIIDEKERFVYAPEKEMAGKSIDKASFQGYSLKDFSQIPNMGRLDSYVVRSDNISDSKWRFIQINSEALLNRELGKAMESWAAVLVIYILCAVLVSASIAKGITRPIVNMIRNMKEVGHGNFNIQLARTENRELSDLIDSFQIMIEEVNALMKANIQKEHEKTAMLMQALNAKINSHFLYNTLNTIKWQAVKNRQMKIAESIVALTKILEYSYKDTDSMVCLSEEIAFINDYAYIQNMRYDSHVEITYEIEENLKSCLLLKMLLQPIVENAFMYAFDKDKRENRICIACSQEEGKLKLVIRDNGKGFAFQGMDKLTGIGLNNVLQRMRISYEKECSMDICSKDGEGTIVTVVIPKQQGDVQDEDVDCR